MTRVVLISLGLGLALAMGCAAVPSRPGPTLPFALTATPSATPSLDGWVATDAVLPIGPVAGGQDGAPAPPAERANVIRPYLWMAGIDGDVTVRGVEADVDASFGDVLDALDFGAMVSYEHRFPGGNALLLDAFYTRLTEDAEVLGVEVDSTMELAYLESSGVFPLGEPAPGDPAFEAIAGARWWYGSEELELGPIDQDASADWVDPLVGLRVLVPLCPGWDLAVRGDVGGFDIGSASHRSWQGTAVAKYQVSDRTALGIGYRYLSLDREQGSGSSSKEFDLALHGALVGLEYHF